VYFAGIKSAEQQAQSLVLALVNPNLINTGNANCSVQVINMAAYNSLWNEWESTCGRIAKKKEEKWHNYYTVIIQIREASHSSPAFNYRFSSQSGAKFFFFIVSWYVVFVNFIWKYEIKILFYINFIFIFEKIIYFLLNFICIYLRLYILFLTLSINFIIHV